MKADFYNSPRYQRMLQRYQRMTPEQRAIVSTAALDEQYGSDEMRKQLNLIELGLKKKAFDEGLAFAKQKFSTEMDFNRNRFEFGKSQERKNELLGIANLAGAGFLGYKGYQSTINEIVNRKLMEYNLLKAIGRSAGSPLPKLGDYGGTR